MFIAGSVLDNQIGIYTNFGGPITTLFEPHGDMESYLFFPKENSHMLYFDGCE